MKRQAKADPDGVGRSFATVTEYALGILADLLGSARVRIAELTTANLGFMLLPRRWVVERDLAWMARFRRLALDYECLAETLAGL